MIRLFLVATCQIATLELLAQNMLKEATVWGIDYSDHTAYRDKEVAETLRHMEEADIILAQRGALGVYNFDTIKTAFPKKTYALASIYFRGLHPDNCYVGTFGDKFQDPSLYHSIAVLEAFRSGRSLRWAMKNAFTFDNFKRLDLCSAWQESLNEMQGNDKIVDFPAASLVENYCHEAQGFLNFNHPTIYFMHRYLWDVFMKLGLSVHAANLSMLDDPLVVHDLVPIHDFIAEYYDLPYRTSQHWKLYHLNKFIERQDYICRFYEAYRKADPIRLTVNNPPDLVRHVKASVNLSFLGPETKEKTNEKF